MTVKSIILVVSEQEFEALKSKKVQMALEKKEVVSWERFFLEVCLK